MQMLTVFAMRSRMTAHGKKIAFRTNFCIDILKNKMPHVRKYYEFVK